MRSFALVRARAENYPGVFQDIVQMIGEDAAAKLIEEHGGTRLYIPSSINSEKHLYQLLGQETALQLTSEFGGMTVEIPRGVMLQIGQRNKLILADRVAGMTQRQLARKYELTERTIRKITNS